MSKYVEELNEMYTKKFGSLCKSCDTYKEYCRCPKDIYQSKLVIVDVLDVDVKIIKLYNMKIKINYKELNFNVTTSKGKVTHFTEEGEWTNLSFDEKVAIRSLIYDYKYE